MVVHQVAAAAVVVVVVEVVGGSLDKTQSFVEGVDRLIDPEKCLPAITQ